MVAKTPGHYPVCSKRFPKRFTSVTVVREDGYPEYRRRDDRQYIPVLVSRNNDETVNLDNSWVVPYNSDLSRKYRAHINVEVCASVQAVKYIHKYIYKGGDRPTLRVDQADNDEISQYLHSRCIGPSEALWRLFEYRLESLRNLTSSDPRASLSTSTYRLAHVSCSPRTCGLSAVWSMVLSGQYATWSGP